MKKSLLVFLTYILFSTNSFAIPRRIITTDGTGKPVVRKLAPTAEPQNQNSEYDGGAQMGMPMYQGNACPQGSISSTLSPDNKTLSVLFNTFTTSAGQTPVDRKMC